MMFSSFNSTAQMTNCCSMIQFSIGLSITKALPTKCLSSRPSRYHQQFHHMYIIICISMKKFVHSIPFSVFTHFHFTEATS